MKIFNITLVLTTMACAFAEASPMKDRMLFKRQSICAEICPVYQKEIVAFKEFFTAAHDGLMAQGAATSRDTKPNVPIPPEFAQSHEEIAKFADALTAAGADKTNVAASMMALVAAADELNIPKSAPNTSISPAMLVFINIISNSVKHIRESAEAFVNAGCP
ncbi:hypothetical protein BGZ96_004845 [Linnemannia gamsii]|uniref:Uncharacterized protein n=1 Tax=Linnemannia gamsii TaxID=64522 RepID=A0ABQ7K6B0_9FUNG|nr:hypothetical protein BGZ96_004845 [Linnemannia gamsii]